MENDTIAAIATAAGQGSISIIRVSGSDSISSVDRHFFSANKSLSDDSILSKADSHTIHYGYFGKKKDEPVDEVLVLIMRAPKSYTMEDVVEIHCHGGIMACHIILETLLESGIRLAEPGEFTKRAFLNGRIDLTQAESVMDIISSKNELATENAIKTLRGDISDEIRSLREILLEDMAHLEAGLDDPEHIDLEGFGIRVKAHIENIRQRTKKLSDSYMNGQLISSGIKTAIVGKPNVGKSSFLNFLLKNERAIVTDIPGTTRDTLEEDIRIGSFMLHLTDTAGIRHTGDTVEKIGVERAMDAAAEADMIFYVIDSSEKTDENDIKILKIAGKKPGIIVLNKSDLPCALSEEDVIFITNIQSDNSSPATTDNTRKAISISTKTGEGREEFEKAVTDLIIQSFDNIEAGGETFITSLRQKEALDLTLSYLDSLSDTIDAGMPEDLYTVDMTGAYEALGKLIGESIEDDLADKIFSDFCMGK